MSLIWYAMLQIIGIEAAQYVNAQLHINIANHAEFRKNVCIFYMKIMINFIFIIILCFHSNFFIARRSYARGVSFDRQKILGQS